MDLFITIVSLGFILVLVITTWNSQSKSDYNNGNLKNRTSLDTSIRSISLTSNTKSIRSMIQKAIDEEMDIIITYRKYDGTTSQRQLSNIEYNNEYGSYGYSNDHIKGYCHLRKEYRVFRIDRISRIVLRSV